MKWCNDIEMTSEEEKQIILLRKYGCKCDLPLLGYVPGQGPRCRLCNVEAIEENEEDIKYKHLV